MLFHYGRSSDNSVLVNEAGDLSRGLEDVANLIVDFDYLNHVGHSAMHFSYPPTVGHATTVTYPNFSSTSTFSPIFTSVPFTSRFMFGRWRRMTSRETALHRISQSRLLPERNM